MTLTTRTQTYDVVIVGGGPAGEVLAPRLTAAGMTVVLVEAELVGGECGYWACIPSKALLRSGHARRAARRVPGNGELDDRGPEPNPVLARRDAFVAHFDDTAQVKLMEESGVQVLHGHGRVAGPRRVVVTTLDDETVELVATRAVVLATGSSAAVPSIPGLAEAGPWTSREATSASRVPRRLIVLGGGPVGLEMAQAWRSLGSEQVVVLVRDSTLLPRLEPFVGESLLAGLTNDGIEVRLGAGVVRVKRELANGEVVVQLDDGSAVVGDELLVAVGRQPATGDLGLESVGLQPGAYLPVDDTCQVADTDWLYALGDVNGRALLTHQGKYQARVAAAAVLARSRGEEPPYRAEADHSAVPQVIFTDPEVAVVGLSSTEAAERGLRVRTVEYDIGDVVGALLYADGYAGHAALVVDEEEGVLVGASFVGQDTAELLHAATVAIVGRVPVERLRHAVPSFPTMSEVWLNLLEQYGQ